ncbi:hypothetical protein PHLCEN_2v5420 [Hermanssonia centrifuga]|uniref:Uncharacterized protein n=1 Tax=Hermanssonia centrifuga TaxID=98765 RepID=A0A2R6P5B4_9APHY|nr:hypothetical protein PHLCEN_2v5420 [Hermanssonia centrifuga]
MALLPRGQASIRSCVSSVSGYRKDLFAISDMNYSTPAESQHTNQGSCGDARKKAYRIVCYQHSQRMDSGHMEAVSRALKFHHKLKLSQQPWEAGGLLP